MGYQDEETDQENDVQDETDLDNDTEGADDNDTEGADNNDASSNLNNTINPAPNPNTNLDALVSTPSPPPAYSHDDHASAYDDLTSKALYGSTGGTLDEANAILRERAPNSVTLFYDSSGSHILDAGGNVLGEGNTPTYGSFADRWDANAWGSLKRRDLEYRGISTAGRKIFNFEGTTDPSKFGGGEPIWKQNLHAPRTDLRFTAFRKAPQPLARLGGVKPAPTDTPLGKIVLPKQSPNDQMRRMDSQKKKRISIFRGYEADYERRRKRNLFPTFPTSTLS